MSCGRHRTRKGFRDGRELKSDQVRSDAGRGQRRTTTDAQSPACKPDAEEHQGPGGRLRHGGRQRADIAGVPLEGVSDDVSGQVDSANSGDIDGREARESQILVFVSYHKAEGIRRLTLDGTRVYVDRVVP